MFKIESIRTLYQKEKGLLTMLLVVMTFILGMLVGISLPKNTDQQKQPYEIRAGGYQFINPLLECELSGSIEEKHLASFKNIIEQKVDTLGKKSDITQVSVYYRDLNNGPWFGIGHEDTFAGASLMKVPILMSYYKAAETDPSILDKEIIYTAELQSEINDIRQASLDESGAEEMMPTYPPEETAELGQTYTVDELLTKMIKYSDNTSKDILIMNTDLNNIHQVEQDLGIIISPIDRFSNDYITVQSYSSIYRVLYNSSYLNRAYSEKTLELLSQSTFDKGLVAGIPSDITVAHKFGEHGIIMDEESVIAQLHDCGIIYHPHNPYLLCVMTRGYERTTLESAIQQISQAVYEQVDTDSP